MKHKLLLSLLLTAVVLQGCAVVPEPRPYYGDPVMVAPPPPRVEYMGPPPMVGYIWIGGYWNWIGMRYQWIPGRWEAPRPGYVWTPHRWDRDGDHWRQSGGQWERRSGDDGRPQGRPYQGNDNPRIERASDLQRRDDDRNWDGPRNNAGPRIERGDDRGRGPVESPRPWGGDQNAQPRNDDGRGWGSRPDSRPDSRPEVRPENRPDHRFDNRFDGRPDGRRDARPDGRNERRPDGGYQFSPPSQSPQPRPDGGQMIRQERGPERGSDSGSVQLRTPMDRGGGNAMPRPERVEQPRVEQPRPDAGALRERGGDRGDRGNSGGGREDKRDRSPGNDR